MELLGSPKCPVKSLLNIWQPLILCSSCFTSSSWWRIAWNCLLCLPSYNPCCLGMGENCRSRREHKLVSSWQGLLEEQDSTLAQMQINGFSELFLNSFAWLQHLLSRNTAAASVTHSCPAGSDMFPHSSCTQDRESFLLPKKEVCIQSLSQRQKWFRGWQCLPCFAPVYIILPTWELGTYLCSYLTTVSSFSCAMSDSPKSTNRGSSSLTLVSFLQSALKSCSYTSFFKIILLQNLLPQPRS